MVDYKKQSPTSCNRHCVISISYTDFRDWCLATEMLIGEQGIIVFYYVLILNMIKLFSPQCPVYDLDNNVAFTGMYQTMTKKGAITVQVMVDLFLHACCVKQQKIIIHTV